MQLHYFFTYILTLKTIYIVLLICKEIQDSIGFLIVCDIMYQVYISLLFFTLLFISQGALICKTLPKIATICQLIIINVAIGLYTEDSIAFGPVLVIAEGFWFLISVKKTLTVLDALYRLQREDYRLADLIKAHTVFLLFLYIFFVDELIMICLKSLYKRLGVGQESLFWETCIAIQEFISNLSLFGIFQVFRKHENIILHKRIKFIQAEVNQIHAGEIKEEYVLVIQPDEINSQIILLGKKL